MRRRSPSSPPPTTNVLCLRSACGDALLPQRRAVSEERPRGERERERGRARGEDRAAGGHRPVENEKVPSVDLLLNASGSLVVWWWWCGRAGGRVRGVAQEQRRASTSSSRAALAGHRRAHPPGWLVPSQSGRGLRMKEDGRQKKTHAHTPADHRRRCTAQRAATARFLLSFFFLSRVGLSRHGI